MTAAETSVVRDAYRTCERTTRKEAANFFYGIRLLPPDKRKAMSAVYAFARRVDDVGDGTLPADEKLAALTRERQALRALGANGASMKGDPVIVALEDARRRFHLPVDALTQLIDGVEMDVCGTSYETFDQLVVYCGCVAGSIGRLCVAIFGSRDPVAAVERAEELGVAMQLTNILRDIREDHENGRVYLPAEDVRRFLGDDDPLAGGPDETAALVAFEAQRAAEWFDRGLGLLPLLDRRSAACLLAMSGIYRRILQRIREHPNEVVHRRVSVPTWEKAVVAARSMAGMPS
jgi:phytoene synthase